MHPGNSFSIVPLVASRYSMKSEIVVLFYSIVIQSTCHGSGHVFRHSCLLTFKPLPKPKQLFTANLSTCAFLSTCPLLLTHLPVSVRISTFQSFTKLLLSTEDNTDKHCSEQGWIETKKLPLACIHISFCLIIDSETGFNQVDRVVVVLFLTCTAVRDNN